MVKLVSREKVCEWKGNWVFHFDSKIAYHTLKSNDVYYIGTSESRPPMRPIKLVLIVSPSSCFLPKIENTGSLLLRSGLYSEVVANSGSAVGKSYIFYNICLLQVYCTNEKGKKQEVSSKAVIFRPL